MEQWLGHIVQHIDNRDKPGTLNSELGQESYFKACYKF